MPSCVCIDALLMTAAIRVLLIECGGTGRDESCWNLMRWEKKSLPAYITTLQRTNQYRVTFI